MAVIQNHCAPIWLSTNPGWYRLVTVHADPIVLRPLMPCQNKGTVWVHELLMNNQLKLWFFSVSLVVLGMIGGVVYVSSPLSTVVLNDVRTSSEGGSYRAGTLWNLGK